MRRALRDIAGFSTRNQLSPASGRVAVVATPANRAGFSPDSPAITSSCCVGKA